MQLEFVNVSGSEPWKNKEAKKFVRSHAMKDFRRRQREGVVGSGKDEVAQSKLAGFGTTDLALSARKNQNQQAPGASSDWSQSTQPWTSLTLELDGFDATLGNFQIIQESIPPQTQPLPWEASDSSVKEPPGWQRALQLSREASVGPQLPLTFDVRVSILVDTVLNAVEGGFDNIVTNYLKTTHSWLCMIHEERYMKRLAEHGDMPDAEFAIVTLAMYLASPAADGFKDGKEDKSFLFEVYRSVKELHRVRAAQGPCFLMVIAGVLIALFEISHGNNTATQSTLQITTSTAYTLGLDMSMTYTLSSHPRGTSLLEERKRVWWALIIIDRFAAMAHPQKHDHPLAVKTPEKNVLLPRTVDDGWSYSDEFNLVAGETLPVSVVLPTDADGMCREAQAAYVLGKVYDLTSQDFPEDSTETLAAYAQLDREIQLLFSKLCADAQGVYMRFCGPISLCICALYMLHWCQLEKTKDRPSTQCQQATTMSRLALEKTIQMSVDILRMFQASHCVELSPGACFSTFQGAMLYLELTRDAEERGLPTLLDPTDFDLIYDMLKFIATVWHSAAKCVEIIDEVKSSRRHRLS